MANYIATCRTNYFKVKNAEAFKEALTNISDIDIYDEDQGFCLVGCNADGGGWPGYVYDEAKGEEFEIDLRDIVAEHLADGEVAIFMEVGAEKARYLCGYAEAVNSKGETRVISLESIYDLANELTDRPSDITHASY